VIRALVNRLIHLAPRRPLLVGLVAGFMLLAGSAPRADLDRLADVAFLRYGADGANAAHRWSSLIHSVRDLPDVVKLVAVNDYFNANVGFGPDQAVWGATDYWATPLETLGRGKGDCEDFSIGKYVTLGLLGVPLDRLRITYVRADTGAAASPHVQAHMVLAYYSTPDSEPLILDNLDRRLLPASARPDLLPVFGFNSEDLWLAGVRAPADPSARLSRWRDLLRRLGAEGLN